MPSNIEIVQAAYAAFGRGDVPGILALLAPDVRWEVVGDRAHFPTFGRWDGAEAVLRFFEAVGENEAFSIFDPNTFDLSGENVFVSGHCESVIQRSGEAIAYDFLHIFTVRDGKIVAFREFFDSATIAQAYAA